MKYLFIALVLMSFPAFSQQNKTDGLWLPFAYFIGKWEGVSDGEPGKGNYKRDYEFVLNMQFLKVQNTAIYPKTQKHKKQTHQDVGYISYDKARKTFILRQFHNEGFVNEYILESISLDKKTIVFITESIENLPNGWKARETYTIENEKQFNEVFELAEPGKDFRLYSKSVLKKQN